MAIRFACGECGKTLSVNDELAGKRVKCPCGAVVIARAAAGPAAVSRPAGATKPAPVRPLGQKVVASRAAGSLAGKPMGRPAANPYAAPGSDLSSLFDELTEADLQTQKARDQAAADAHAAVIDPLAAYQNDKPGKAKRGGAGGPRPLGVTLLAVLNFLVAIVAFGLGALFLLGTQALGDRAAEIEGLQDIATMVAVMILVAGGFYASVGAGLLSGQVWGWWLGATVYAYNVADRVFYSVFALIEGEPADAAFKKAGAIFFAVAILSYFFKDNVREHFGIKTKPAIAAAITLGSMTLFAFFVHLGLHLMVVADAAE